MTSGGAGIAVRPEEWYERPAVRSAHRRALTVLSISHVVGAIGIGAGPAVGVLLAEAMTSSELMAGLSRTASTLGAAFASIPLAALADRSGRRNALTVGWSTAGVGALLVVGATFSQSVLLLVLGMLVFGAGTATTLQSRFAATDLAPRSHRARSLALVVWVGTIGSVIGPNIGIPGGWLDERFGLPTYAGAFLIATVFLVLGGLLVQFLLRPDSHDVDASQRGAGIAAPPRRPRLTLIAAARVVGQLTRNPQQRVAFISLVCAHTIMVTLMTMSPVHMHHHGGDVSIVGLTISLHVLGMFALAPLSGYLADSIGYVPTILVGVVVFLASIVTGVTVSETAAGMMVCLFLLGWGWSFVTVAASAMLTAAASEHDRLSVQGASDTMMNLVAAVAAAVSGPIMAAITFPGLSALCILLIAPIVILSAQWTITRQRRRVTETE